MAEKNNLNGLVLMDKKKLVKMLDDLKPNIKPKKPRWYYCNICGDRYQEGELIIDKEVGCICGGCAKAKKELDDEQEVTEKMREKKEFHKEEMKGKAGYFDKEGP